MAPGRFAAALNQAPMLHRGGSVYPLDWFINKTRVWNTPYATPAQVLREVFMCALNYTNARQRLIETPLAAPAIFSLAGIQADELCIIERTEMAAYVCDGAHAVANAWQAPGWTGRERGRNSAGRVAEMLAHVVEPRCDMDGSFKWLKPPILNDLTRLVMMSDAARGTLIAQGYERGGPATRVLELQF